MATIREAAADDVPRLVEILRESPEAGNWPEADLQSSLESATRRCWVAEQEGRVAGFLLVQSPAADETEILTLAVERAARRRGIARALLRTSIGGATGRVWLEVRASNAPARELYREQGFIESGLRRDYYSSPREDAVVMHLSPDQ